MKRLYIFIISLVFVINGVHAASLLKKIQKTVFGSPHTTPAAIAYSATKADQILADSNSITNKNPYVEQLIVLAEQQHKKIAELEKEKKNLENLCKIALPVLLSTPDEMAPSDNDWTFVNYPPQPPSAAGEPPELDETDQ